MIKNDTVQEMHEITICICTNKILCKLVANTKQNKPLKDEQIFTGYKNKSKY